MKAADHVGAQTRTIISQLLCTLVVIGLHGGSPPHAAVAAESVDEFGWFDAERGTLRRPGKSVHAPPAPDLSEPRSPRDWTWEPPDFSRNNNWNFSGLSDGIARLLQFLAWALLAGIALWFVMFVLRSYRDLELGQKPNSDRRELEQIVDIEKLADLPFKAPTAGGDLLSLIRQRYEQGQFGDAIVLLFGYQLLKLDKSHLIRILKGKTNRQYVRELAYASHSPRLREMLTQTMVTFEDYFFGDHAITREEFEACWGQLDEFHSMVEAPA